MVLSAGDEQRPFAECRAQDVGERFDRLRFDQPLVDRVLKAPPDEREPVARDVAAGLPAQDRRRFEQSDSLDGRRSEEHTSELQSPCNLVCRLLLEKKKLRRTAEGSKSM